MASAQAMLRIAFNGEDKLAAIIENNNREWRKFKRFTKEAEKQATGTFATIRGQIKGVTTTYGELNAKVMLLKEAFNILQGAIDTAISGEIATNAETIFNQIAGGGEKAAAIMKRLETESRGLLTGTDIQQFSGMMKLAGVEFEDIARMMTLASNVTLATGEDTLGMLEKLKAAALEGSQGEFEKLGVTINVNAELQRRAEAEGRLLEEMSKSEQVSARLDILQQRLVQTMKAAGMNTAILSTELRNLKTNMDNMKGSAEQAFADLFTDDYKEQMLDQIEAEVRALERARSFGMAIGRMKNDRDAILKLSKTLNLSEAQIQEVLSQNNYQLNQWMFSARTAAEKFLPLIMDAQREVFEEEQRQAQASIDAENEKKEEKRKAILAILEENRNLELELVDIRARENKAEEIATQAKIKMNLLSIERLKGLALNLFEFKKALLDKETAAAKASAEKAETEKTKAEKKASADAAKRRRDDAKRREEKAEAERRKRQRMELDAAQLRLQIEIDAARRAGDIQAAQSLERQKLAESRNKTFMLTDMQHHEEMTLFRANFDKQEIDLAVSHGEELLALRDKQSQLSLEIAQSHADAMKALREQELADFQQSIDGYAAATERMQEPLLGLVEHERGASSQLKVTAAAIGASSAAMQTYARETDQQASASERFVQGLGPMISAGGVAASAFVKQTKTKALVQGSFEAASALAALATGNLVGAAGHTAAAAAFFALAGKSKSGGAPAATAQRTGSLSAGGGGTGMTASGGGQSITVNVQGFAMGSAVDMGASLGQTIDSARHTGLDRAEV